MYELKGQVQGGIIGMTISIGIMAAVLVFMSVLAGQVYNQTEQDINDIANTTVRADVQSAAQSGFEALETFGNYTPIIVLALVISVVLFYVSLMQFNATTGGSAL